MPVIKADRKQIKEKKLVDFVDYELIKEIIEREKRIPVRFRVLLIDGILYADFGSFVIPLQHVKTVEYSYREYTHRYVFPIRDSEVDRGEIKIQGYSDRVQEGDIIENYNLVGISNLIEKYFNEKYNINGDILYVSDDFTKIKDPFTGNSYELRLYIENEDDEKELYEIINEKLKEILANLNRPDIVIEKEGVYRHLFYYEMAVEMGYGAEYAEIICVEYKENKLNIYHTFEVADIGDCGAKGFNDFGGLTEIMEECPKKRGVKVLSIEDIKAPVALKFLKRKIENDRYKLLGSFEGQYGEIFVYKLSL